MVAACPSGESAERRGCSRRGPDRLGPPAHVQPRRAVVSEEKTRVVRGKKPASREPQRVGDKIVFYCPNGDRIVVKAEAGGNAARAASVAFMS